MIVVADTGPLNYLVRLQRIDLLHLFYRRVIVPDAVIEELRHAGAPSAVRSWAAALPGWLDVRTVSIFDESLSKRLGPGERQAISLALELGAETLLIDELEGRKQARARQLAVAGTLAVLVQSALSDYLELPGELRKLRSVGFRMGSALESDTLALYERLRRQQAF